MLKEVESSLVGLINALADVQKHALGLLFGGIPEEVKSHLRNARKEKLLALRACIDAAISRLEEKEKLQKQTQERKKVKKVEVK